MSTKRTVSLGVILALGITAGMVLFVDLDYSRYADAVTQTAIETAQQVSIEIDEIPKIKVFTGCADLYDKIAWYAEQYETTYQYQTVGETQWLFEEIDEMKKTILENNCQEWWMNNQ